MPAASTLARASARLAPAPPRARARLAVRASKDSSKGSGQRSGIHDPAGPAGSWGRGEATGHKHGAAEGDKNAVARGKLEGQERRSGPRAAGRAHGLDRERAARHEFGEMEAERAAERAPAAEGVPVGAPGSEGSSAAGAEASDADTGEHPHLSAVERLWLKGKGALWTYTASGVEPL
jgi:hypothetical protein